MSAKIMGKVWDLELPHNQLLVLLALADHADHEGNNVFPSLGLIAWKTGYSEQQVRRVLKALEKAKVLIAVERKPGKVTCYSIDLSAGKLKPARVVISTKKSPLTKSKGLHSDTPDPLHFEHSTPDISREKVEGINRHKEPSIEPKRKPDLIYNAISDVWNTTASGVIVRVKSMLLGTAKSGEWADANFDVPATPDEIYAFGQWWKRKHPDLTLPNKPDKIQRWFYEYRRTAAKSVITLDPAHDLSIQHPVTPMLLDRAVGGDE